MYKLSIAHGNFYWMSNDIMSMLSCTSRCSIHRLDVGLVTLLRCNGGLSADTRQEVNSAIRLSFTLQIPGFRSGIAPYANCNLANAQ